MKTSFFRIIILSLIFFFSNSLYLNAQIEEEEGYVKLEGGQVINCKILNKDWQFNPKEIEYSTGDAKKKNKISLYDLEEFAIGDSRKYTKFIIEVDKSSRLMDELDYNKTPVMTKDTVFMRVLVEGKYTLYEYANPKFIRYFYSVDGSLPEQLIYKEYFHTAQGSSERTVKKNEHFKSQILKNINCSKTSFSEIKGLRYFRKPLINIFKKQNECSGMSQKVFVNKTKRQKFKLTAKGGPKYVRTKDTYPTFGEIGEKRSAFGFKAGIQIEVILPFAKNKFSLSTEPSFNYFKGSYDSKVPANNNPRTTTYSSIDIPLNLNYYIFLNKNARISIPIGVVYSLPLSSSVIAYELTSNGVIFGNVNLNPNDNLTFFTGANFHYGQYQLGATYEVSRDALTDYEPNTFYSAFNLQLGYTFLTK